MKQMKKTNRGWKLAFMLPLAGLLVMTAISAPAQAERLASVTPTSIASGGTLTVHGQFNTRYIRDRRYRYHLSLYPRRGGSATYLTIIRSTATALTARVPRSVAPGSYSMRVDMQLPGGGFGGIQQSNAIPITITRTITIRPVRPAQQVVGTIVSISSITPDVLTPGDRLLIKGRGFGRRQQAGGRRNTILFSSRGGWVTIPVQSWSDTMIMTRPINQKPAGGGVVKLHFYRNNREVLTRQAFLEFHNPRILGYQPTKVRPGDRITVNVRDIPNGQLLWTRFGAALMRGNRQLMRIPFGSLSRRSDSMLSLYIPRNAEGNGLSIALYRTSDSKVVSNLLPGLDISRSAIIPIRVAFLPTRARLCRGNFPVVVQGGPFQSGVRVELAPPSQYGNASVSVKSPGSLLSIMVNHCWLLNMRHRLRVVYPDGTKSNWLNVGVSGIDRVDR